MLGGENSNVRKKYNGLSIQKPAFRNQHLDHENGVSIHKSPIDDTDLDQIIIQVSAYLQTEISVPRKGM